MKRHTEELHPLIKIGNVTIYSNREGSYIQFKSDLDVCTDGTGEHYDDQSPQDETAYYNGGKFLNADVDQYIVIPPQVRSMVGPVVMGCQARATRISTKQAFDAVTGEIGPDNKTGEAAICLAQKLNPNVSANSGDSKHDYLYELWPGVPAKVNGKHYKLESAG
jgi:hypothetical protein